MKKWQTIILTTGISLLTITKMKQLVPLFFEASMFFSTIKMQLFPCSLRHDKKISNKWLTEMIKGHWVQNNVYRVMYYHYHKLNSKV